MVVGPLNPADIGEMLDLSPAAASREVLRAIGSGERTFTNIARAAGGIAGPAQRAAAAWAGRG